MLHFFLTLIFQRLSDRLTFLIATQRDKVIKKIEDDLEDNLNDFYKPLTLEGKTDNEEESLGLNTSTTLQLFLMAMFTLSIFGIPFCFRRLRHSINSLIDSYL